MNSLQGTRTTKILFITKNNLHIFIDYKISAFRGREREREKETERPENIFGWKIKVIKVLWVSSNNNNNKKWLLTKLL